MVVWLTCVVVFSLYKHVVFRLYKHVVLFRYAVVLSLLSCSDYNCDHVGACRIHKRPCATYETASLRRFQLGRTDTIRSCSTDTLEFTQGMENPALPDAAKVALLRQAVKSHRKYTDEVGRQ